MVLVPVITIAERAWIVKNEKDLTQRKKEGSHKRKKRKKRAHKDTKTKEKMWKINCTMTHLGKKKKK